MLLRFNGTGPVEHSILGHTLKSVNDPRYLSLKTCFDAELEMSPEPCKTASAIFESYRFLSACRQRLEPIVMGHKQKWKSPKSYDSGSWR